MGEAIYRRINMDSLKRTLMISEGLTSREAEEKMAEARDQLNSYLANGDLISAEDICEEFFGLEPDYLFDLI